MTDEIICNCPKDKKGKIVLSHECPEHKDIRNKVEPALETKPETKPETK